MTLTDYLAKTKRIAQKHGYQQALTAASNEAIAKTAFRPFAAYQTQVAKKRLTHQIDLLDRLRAKDRYCLIIFDAGRYDFCHPIFSDQYQGKTQATFSAARDTFEWISKVWQGDYQDVTYLSGMVPVSDEIPDFDLEDFKRLYDGINPGDSIGEIIPLWKSDWDHTLSTVTPERIVDHAIDYADRDKLVVHLNQPHSPYIGTPQLLGHTENESAKPHQGRPNDEPIWQRVRTGDISDTYLRMAYAANAARAITAVKPLVQQRETVVLTADHGEALGELGMYTHDRAPHPNRRVVPWMEVEGMAETENTTADSDVTDRLEALGYR